MTVRCESCGNVPAFERELEPCQTDLSSGTMHKVCIFHNLCEDCFTRYKAMDEDGQTRFRDHLISAGSGVAVEF